MLGRIFLGCLFLLLIAACTPETATIPAPASTVGLPSITSTETATPASKSESSPLPSETEAPLATFEPTFTSTSAIPLPLLAFPTVTATDVPQPEAQTGAIQFYKPGPMSWVTSPVGFYGYAIPGFNDKGLIELYGEDGSVLNSEILQLSTAYKWAFFSWKLSFETRGAGELSRLSLSTRDQYGRLTALRALHLLLLPAGPEIINPAEELVERCILDAPIAGKRIAGGKVEVSGEMLAYNYLPLKLELIGIDGSILGSQAIAIPPGQAGKYFQFRIDILYSVRVSTAARLTISQADDSIPGTMYLYSQEITLNP